MRPLTVRPIAVNMPVLSIVVGDAPESTEANAYVMKLLYCSDLHGSEGHYARLSIAAKTHAPDIIILGGDMLPDDSALDPETLGKGQPEYVRQQFRQAVTELRGSCRLQTVLVIFGNHDWASSAVAVKKLADEGLVVALDHKTVFESGGLRFLGYSCTPPTPWFVKDFERLDMPGDVAPLLGGARWDPRFSKAMAHASPLIYNEVPTIADELAELESPAQPWVLVAHAPPFGTNLDRSYKGESWGSRAIRAAIEKHQPLLSLHGHVHESPVVSGSPIHRLGKTVAINPGQARDCLRYALIEVDIAACEIGDIIHGQQA
jgi:uncharacterized protein